MNRAMLVVDMQNGFCHPQGSFTRIDMGLEGADQAVHNAATAVAQARRAAIPVVFTRHLYRPGRADEGRALMRDFAVTLLADCCAAKTRRLHELSIEVLSSYQLAEIASITEGFDVGAAEVPIGV